MHFCHQILIVQNIFYCDYSTAQFTRQVKHMNLKQEMMHKSLYIHTVHALPHCISEFKVHLALRKRMSESGGVWQICGMYTTFYDAYSSAEVTGAADVCIIFQKLIPQYFSAPCKPCTSRKYNFHELIQKVFSFVTMNCPVDPMRFKNGGFHCRTRLVKKGVDSCCKTCPYRIMSFT